MVHYTVEYYSVIKVTQWYMQKHELVSEYYIYQKRPDTRGYILYDPT